jgi:hypothetical protein
MSPKEPFYALGFCAFWGIVGLIYFVSKSKKMGKEMFLTKPPAPTAA